MNIWLIIPGEPTKLDPGKPRLLRTGMLAEYLHRRGHRIVFWTTSENHVVKENRCGQSLRLAAGERYAIWLLYGPRYRRNVSLRRIWHNMRSAREFRRLAPREERPDVILSAYPTLELCEAAIDYARGRGVPVLVDVRDLWPDIFLEIAPRPLARAMGLLLTPMFRQSRRIFRSAAAITGITEAAVAWAVARGGAVDPAAPHRAFPMAYSPRPVEGEERAEAEAFWDRRGVPAGGGRFVACFFGQLSARYELPAVVEAARLLAQRGDDRIRFVVCGTGEAQARLKRLAAGLTNIDFPGWMNTAQIWVLLRRSAVGLLPYPSSLDYRLSYPNKAGEYLSAGLPIVSSVQGAMQSLLENNGCGVTYGNGDAVELAAVLEELAASPARREAMSDRSRALFERLFNADRVYADFCDHLEAMAAAAANASGV